MYFASDLLRALLKCGTLKRLFYFTYLYWQLAPPHIDKKALGNGNSLTNLYKLCIGKAMEFPNSTYVFERNASHNIDINEIHLEKGPSRIPGFEAIRTVQVIVGIVGNALTLIIIYNLKHRVNGHIIMMYLAVTDILVCCMFPTTLVTEYARYSPVVGDQIWKDICIIQEYFIVVAMACSCLSYLMSSVDR